MYDIFSSFEAVDFTAKMIVISNVVLTSVY